MKRLFFKIWADGGWRRAMHLTLCVAWVSLAMVYAGLAYEAHLSRNSKLPRAGFRIPVHRRVQLSNARLEEVLNSVAEKYDASVIGLERSLQTSAQTRLRLDGVAAVLSCLGLVAQVVTLRRLTRSQRAQGWPVPISRGKLRPSTSALRPAKLHEGSFPEGGYAS
jgi:hypothetical protein